MIARAGGRTTGRMGGGAGAETFLTDSPDETMQIGRVLAGRLLPPRLVILRGDLGAGKTTLVKGFAAAFLAVEPEEVTSPTFTLIHEYRGTTVNIFHIDLYRLETAREVESLALQDLRSPDAVLLIEWGEKFPEIVGEADAEIAIRRCGESQSQREIVLTIR